MHICIIHAIDYNYLFVHFTVAVYANTRFKKHRLKVLPYCLCPLRCREIRQSNLERVSVPADFQNDLDHLLQDWVVDSIPYDRNLLAFYPCLRHVAILPPPRFPWSKVPLLLITQVNLFRIHL